MSRLRCESCGLGYSRTAIAREMALVTGVACRRCGGTLQAEDAHEDRGNREAGTGRARRPPEDRN